MGEKFREWPEEPMPMDEILTNVTLWWFTDSAARCIYTYRETFLCDHEMNIPYIEKPFGYSWYMYELVPGPKLLVEKRGRLVFYRQHAKVSHPAHL